MIIEHINIRYYTIIEYLNASKEIRVKTMNLKNNRQITYIVTICLSVMVIATILSIVFFRYQLKTLPAASQSAPSFERHYAFVCSKARDNFNNAVYEAASEAFLSDGDYLEFMGRNLNTQYTRNELLEIAIDAKVDGIILEADESEEVTKLINRANSEGIPVITMGSDNTSSGRKSFVGFGYYDVGQNYGKEILKQIKDEPQTVLILMKQDTDNTGQNTIFQGIRDTLNKSESSKYFRLGTMAVSETSTFGAEESISSLIMSDEPLPDIMICLNELYTTCALQALVDYNRVGKTDLYGFYTNNTILQDISKNILSATVTVDTKQMGRYCFDAMREYERYGFVNEYMPADIEVITADNVSKYLEKEVADE